MSCKQDVKEDEGIVLYDELSCLDPEPIMHHPVASRAVPVHVLDEDWQGPSTCTNNNNKMQNNDLIETVSDTSSIKQEYPLDTLSMSPNSINMDPTLDTSSIKDQVLIGTPIRQGHVNYLLMYNMLTGIRISVSRCHAKAHRPLQPMDFKAAHKLAFDSVGQELSPHADYHFKFKDYAPFVFRKIRQTFGVDPNDYLTSLTGQYVLSELGSPGKSGSFFYFSRDYRFIIKTIHPSEHRFLIHLLQHYQEYVDQHPDTYLCRIFGLHRIKMPGKQKTHFVVMENVFPADRDIHQVYDLKGSLFGRETRVSNSNSSPLVTVYKDINFIKNKVKIQLNQQKDAFLAQIEQDAQFLEQFGIMDYSLLLGIHHAEKGNKEMIRNHTLSLCQPHPQTLSHLPRKSSRTSRLLSIRRKTCSPDPVTRPFEPPCSDSCATESAPFVYYIGIIDILTHYSIKKRLEHAWRSLIHPRQEISAVHPTRYKNRFVEFIKKHTT